jgi:galactokinase
LSSSSALVVGSFLTLARVSSLTDSDEYRQAIPNSEALAGYLGAVENGYAYGSLEGAAGVGTFGGSEDHAAILCGRRGNIVQYSYSPVRFEKSIELPPELIFVIAASGVHAEKTGSAKADYNRLSLQSRAIANLWREGTGQNLSDLGSILAADPEAVAKFRSLVRHLEEIDFQLHALVDRFEHFQQENEVIVPAAAAALEAGDIGQFGEWIDRSMELAESLLGNQIPETCFLAAEARQLGAMAASAFGAGFGGAVWALVSRARAETLMYHLKESYLRAFPRHRQAAKFFLTEAGPPAMEISPKS